MTKFLSEIPLLKEWITDFTHFKKFTNKQEKDWGCKINREYFNYNKNTCQWTTNLGEQTVKELVSYIDGNVKRPKVINSFKPDWESSSFIWEVKTRNYTTSGTAGEKIIGTPYKYSDIRRLYGKPLRIVLVGFQECEAEHSFKLFKPDSSEKKYILDTWENLGIKFVKCSDLWRKTEELENNFADISWCLREENINTLSDKEWENMSLDEKENYIDEMQDLLLGE